MFVSATSFVLSAFALIYFIRFGHSAAFDPPLGRTSAAYFTLGTFTTVGSGISAKSTGAQYVVIGQMVIDVFLVVIILGNLAAQVRFGPWFGKRP
jgi:hypothetical protein